MPGEQLGPHREPDQLTSLYVADVMPPSAQELAQTTPAEQLFALAVTEATMARIHDARIAELQSEIDELAAKRDEALARQGLYTDAHWLATDD